MKRNFFLVLMIFVFFIVNIGNGNCEQTSKKERIEKIVNALNGVKVESIKISITINKDLSAHGNFLARISGLKDSSKLDDLIRKCNKNIRKQSAKFKKIGLKVGELSYGSTSTMYMVKNYAECTDIFKIPSIISKKEPVKLYMKGEKDSKININIIPDSVLQLLAPFISYLEINVKVPVIKEHNGDRVKDGVIVWNKSWLIPKVEFSFEIE